MLKTYELLTDCQSKLNESGMPTIQRTRLEMNILRAKQLIIHEGVRLSGPGAAHLEAELKAVYDQIDELCAPQGNAVEVDAVIESIRLLTELMKDKGTDL